MSICPDTFVSDFHGTNSANECSSAGISYSRLGKTDLIVSNLSLGGSAFGNVFSAMDQITVNDIVLLSIKSGINYVDTAPWYGHGESETKLGIALKDIPRRAYYIATIVGRYAPEANKMFDFSVKTITTQFAESLKRLQLDYVDVLQIHDVEFCKNVHQIVKVKFNVFDLIFQNMDIL